MRNFRRILIGFIPFLFLIGIFSSCERDDDDSISNGPSAPSTIKTQVIVNAKDQNGDPVQGATIKIGSASLITDSKGNVIFKDVSVNSKRFTITAEKNSWFKAIKGVSIIGGNTSYHVKFSLIPLPTPVAISSTTGGNVIINNGASVNFDANSIADATGAPYTGTVQVLAYHYQTNDPNFETMIPGGDLLGKDDDGDDVALVSFGMVNVQLVDPAGNPLNLLPGTTAQISMPIAPDQLATAPNTIPLWYLDETTSLWMEEGQAVKQGNVYVGEVSHFTYWNCDYPGERANITGTVVDCNGDPAPGIVVTLNGFMDLTTNSAGEYSTWVPSGWSITYQVLTQNNPWMQTNSNQVSLTAVANQTNTISVLTVPCATMASGTTQNCNGTPVSSYVTVQQGNQTVQYYQNSGSFSFLIPYSGSTVFSFQSPYGSFDTTIVVPVGNTPISLGTIELCDSSSGAGYDFITLNGANYNNEQIFLTNNWGDAYVDSTNNVTQFYYYGNINPNDWIDIWFTIPLTGTGSFNSNFYTPIHNVFELTNPSFSMNIGNPGDSIAYNITSWNTLTGEIKVSISGILTHYDNNTMNTLPVDIIDGEMTFYMWW